MKKKAIILGATGLTGSHLLELLLNDPDYDVVKVFTRNKLTTFHPKIEEHIMSPLRQPIFIND